MKYPWLDEYMLAKKSVVKDYKIEWDAVRYLLGDKMICMMAKDNHGRAIITLKCEPNYGEVLRQQYPDIIAGYYMNKTHWNSVYLDGAVPDDILKSMIDMSYRLIVASLSKKTSIALGLVNP